MNLLLYLLSAIFIIFGFGLIFSSARGAFVAALISIGSGVIAYDQHSFIPLIVGFGLLWVLRLTGVEEKPKL